MGVEASATSLGSGAYSGRLVARWITRELADEAGLRRIDSATGRQMFGRKHSDLTRIIIPNVAPWHDGHVRYRERPGDYLARLRHFGSGSPAANILAESKKPATVKWNMTSFLPLFCQNQP